MSRQVDIKSLVSHIVRGDGMDKCRICMGDTSQGQVHLTDTVMMDGDKAVTLSELLEVITGVEVECEEALPPAICLVCSISAFEAAEFRKLVQGVQSQWSSTICLLQHIPESISNNPLTKKIVAVVSSNAITLVDESLLQTSTKATSRKRVLLNKPKEPTIKRFGKTRDCQCPICDKKFRYASLLHKHLKESADLIRACHICAAVMSRNKLVKHLKVSHKIKPYDCKKCPALFVNARPYSEHLLKGHAPGVRTCGDCNRSFGNQAAFRAHQSVHARRTCPNCDKLFQNQMCYTHHVQTCCRLNCRSEPRTVTLQNKQNKTVKMGKRGSTNSECFCDYCNKTFSAKKYVAAHIEIVHTKSTHRPCSYCGKRFAAAHMISHVKTHVNQKYECKECGAVLKSKLGFEQHSRLHSGERPYRCQHCGESFSASSRRSEHIRRKHSQTQISVLRHGCTFCTAKFRLPSKLRLHLREVHTRAKPDSQHECPECREMFATSRSLQLHAEKHLAPRRLANLSLKSEL